jgi:hypothetical protein
VSTTTTHIGRCALCGKEKELQGSHLIPQWAYKRIQHLGEGRQDHPIQVSNGTAIQTSKQVTKRLLCSDCEGRFSEVEGYVAKLTELDEDGALMIMSSLGREGAPHTGMAILKNDIDFKKIVYFAASIIWRSAVMSDSDGCKLGKYIENFRRYLLGEAEFPSQSSMHMLVLEPSESIAKPHRYFTFPSSLKMPTSWLHGFTICGLAFRCFVGGSLQDVVKMANLGGNSPTKYAFLMNVQEFKDFHHVSTTARAATPRGKLAKRSFVSFRKADVSSSRRPS